MFIRNFTFLILVLLVAAPATASAQVSMTYLGLDALEFDDAFGVRFNASFRRQAASVPAWRLREGDTGTSSIELACDCSLSMADCRRTVLAFLGTGSMIYGQAVRAISSDGNDFDYLVRLFRYDALEARVISADQVAIPRYISDEDLDAIVARLIRSFSSGDPVPVAAPLDEDEAPSTELASTDFSELDQPVAPASRSSEFDLEYIGWPLVGLAVASFAGALGTMAAIEGLGNDPSYVAYRNTVPSGMGDACANAGSSMLYEPTSAEAVARLDRARSVCSEGSSLEVAQIVLYVVSGLSAAAGGILIGYDLSLRPSVGADHAFLDVSLTF
ncbi:hypothetical protein IT407_01280 [Candidatus Uhrbacteria bacterium]|nr:hypothetical protein [Candidatus Uhrbacteria bacterium]